MSLRGRKAQSEKAVAQLRSELDDLKNAARAADVAAAAEVSAPAAGDAAYKASAEFDKLTETEKSAASLGVNPDQWRPIAFLNNKHYDNLRANNMLDGDLSRRIEAFRVVSAK